MIIFPAIDLKDGKCVRLYQGKFDKSEVVGEDPIKVAKSFKDAGAKYLHMVDLDGAKDGKMRNYDIIASVVKSIDMPIQIGGGIRNVQTIELLIDAGISRVILGTSALNNPEFVKDAIKEFGEKIAIGIDAKDGFVAVDAWINVSNIEYIDFAKRMEDIGVKTIILTDISRDGTLNGPNFQMLSALKDSVGCDIIASGGIKNIDNLIELKNMELYGAITGKAIYSGNIDLAEAIRILK